MHESISKKTQMKLYKSEEGFEKIMGWYDRVKSEITVQHQSIYAETRFGQSHAILAGEENSKAVILIPGVAGCAPLWRNQINELSKKFKIYALDIVGQPGKSEPNPPSVFNDDYTNWLEDVITSLQLKKPHIIGVSTGGTTAMDMAIANSELIDKVIMCGPTGLARARLPFHQWFSRAMAKQKDADVLEGDLTASSFSKPRSGKTFGSFDRQLARGMALCTRFYRVDKSLGIYNDKTSRINFIKAIKVISKFFFSVDKKRLSSFKNSGLLIFGEFEVLYNPKKISKKIKKLIPNIEVEIIKDAGHAAIYDQPEEVNKKVIAFLEK
ncbi:MAG: alpha/beta hydrolase [Gammaproteobacteria bacterium]|jgi:pimeloyl-ACP methyl ester carboxylesterase|nr:alpha/beta hydrolase [Gammaproteobacteria bacterium]MBT7754544.1 alpha/beta hydrolase [Gammaproteobacteria bacterium]